MSLTYSIVCHETKKQLWIGQSGLGGRCIYSGNPEIMQKLENFLFEHEGKSIEFVCDDSDYRHEDYADFEPDEDED